MYQQSVLRSREVADLLGDPQFSPRHRATAPANDPFVTASVLSEIVTQREQRNPFSIFICARSEPRSRLSDSHSIISENA